MKQTVTFVEPHTTFKIATDSSAFTVRDDRPYLWLQKACCWVLGMLGAYRQDTQKKIEYRTIDAYSFMVRIAKQRSVVFELLNREPKELLIGAEDYAELMRETPAHYLFDFNAQYVRGERGVAQIMGLKVRVIPWMRGVLVIPPDEPL